MESRRCLQQDQAGPIYGAFCRVPTENSVRTENAEVPSIVVRQNEIVSSHEVKSRANLSRPVVVAAQWVIQHEIMLGFEAVQESILT